jgi:hypothetical protein
MRDPMNLKEVTAFQDDMTVITIDNVPEFNIMDYDIEDDKDFVKYINDIKNKVIRTSFEYRAMVAFMRDSIGMNTCSFYENVSNLNSQKIKIHIHHDPLTLEDIIIIVFRKRRYFNESLEVELVGKEVMYLHYKLLVGLIPLAETPHELVHNQYLFVPTTKVFGKYKEFVELYKEFMLPEQLDVLERIEKYTEEYNTNYEHLLARNYIYLDLESGCDLPKLNELAMFMQNKLQEIRNKSNLKKVITKL